MSLRGNYSTVTSTGVPSSERESTTQSTSMYLSIQFLASVTSLNFISSPQAPLLPNCRFLFKPFISLVSDLFFHLFFYLFFQPFLYLAFYLFLFHELFHELFHHLFRQPFLYLAFYLFLFPQPFHHFFRQLFLHLFHQLVLYLFYLSFYLALHLSFPTLLPNSFYSMPSLDPKYTLSTGNHTRARVLPILP
ncbi:hypothetical protein GGR50DRAFT_697633 [Xylaria sp. CBS 124048]|nr:hypothetical protein GGR50DRAFT_697633 [Xylaria sp. CBS 124048]